MLSNELILYLRNFPQHLYQKFTFTCVSGNESPKKMHAHRLPTINYRSYVSIGVTSIQFHIWPWVFEFAEISNAVKLPALIVFNSLPWIWVVLSVPGAVWVLESKPCYITRCTNASYTNYKKQWNQLGVFSQIGKNHLLT